MTLPDSFLQSLQYQKAFNKTAFEAVHASGEQVTSVRLNPQKVLPPYYLDFPIGDPVPWSSFGYYLAQRPSFTFDPLLHAGVYYVQEASSMFLEQALKQSVDLSGALKVLDLCAAPGGKSTLMHSLINESSLLVSNEVIKSRAAILEENLVKWGAGNTVITSSDPSHFARLTGYFDVVVVDAPCSGSGLFRRDPVAIREWSENAVQLCSRRQQRIIAEVWPALKENGILIYSTCSYSREEDEDILDWMINKFDAQKISLRLSPQWGIVETEGGYRFYPDKLKGEGFFITVIQKKESTQNAFTKKEKSRPQKVPAQEAALIKPWLVPHAQIEMIKQGELVHALTVPLYRELPILQSALYIKNAGVVVGKPAAKGLMPHHSLAMSNLLNTAVPRAPLNYEEAICYLRKDEWSFPSQAKGWTLAVYKNNPLGWMKLLSGRVNNYYPASWRILNAGEATGHKPQ